jgi:hypothetical protein
VQRGNIANPEARNYGGAAAPPYQRSSIDMRTLRWNASRRRF